MYQVHVTMTLNVARSLRSRGEWLSTAGEDLKGLVTCGGSVDHYKVSIM